MTGVTQAMLARMVELASRLMEFKPGAGKATCSQPRCLPAAGVSKDSSRQRRQDPLNQSQLFDVVVAKHPEVLKRSVYRAPVLPGPLHTLSLQEKEELFVAALNGMIAEERAGRPLEEVAYDHDQPRLWSFGLQPMWEVQSNRQDSRLLGLESLIALHAGSWGVGLILDVLDDLLNRDLDTYLEFKRLEVHAALGALRRYPGLPTISINLRPTEWMLPQVQQMVLEASRAAPGRIAFELTEYTADVHFPKHFGEEGTLSQRLTRTLLPVLESMKAAGVLLLADDLTPASVYRYEGEAQCKRGELLEATHATECETMLSDAWAAVFHGVKFSLGWSIHAFRLSKDLGEGYAQVPLYVRGVKDNPKHVAAVTDKPVPDTRAGEAAALTRLQEAAAEQLRAALRAGRGKFNCLPVLEATVPPSAVAEWGLQGTAKEQGGMFFEARFPPAWFLGSVS